MLKLAAVDDARWMRAALSIARRGIGNTAPNPSVGCIIVKNGKVVGRGWTQPGGRPHAEAMALDAAGDAAKGAAVFVTLEPCAHTGKTGPCADALIAAGVSSVVVACLDPDPRVAGKGVTKLKDAGLAVTAGVLEKEAKNLNAGFLTRLSQSRPYITLKTATSVDGKIALSSGESKWITGAKSRRHGHMLRAKHDAILTGVGTVLADDPDLTCRIEGLEHESPSPVILDREFKTPQTAKLMQTDRKRQTLLISQAKEAPKWVQHLNAQHLPVDDISDLQNVVGLLAERGVNRLMVEAGAKISASFLKAGLVDEICHYSAGKLIGDDGLGAIGQMMISNLDKVPQFKAYEMRRFGDDTFVRYRRCEE